MMIEWHLHTDIYGNLYSFETWWLAENGKRISPNCPSETPIQDVNYYTKGRKVDRVVRTHADHNDNFQLVGRGFDGKAHHVLAVECFCNSHSVTND